jgi:hypothetical protein
VDAPRFRTIVVAPPAGGVRLALKPDIYVRFAAGFKHDVYVAFAC